MQRARSNAQREKTNEQGATSKIFTKIKTEFSSLILMLPLWRVNSPCLSTILRWLSTIYFLLLCYLWEICFLPINLVLPHKFFQMRSCWTKFHTYLFKLFVEKEIYIINKKKLFNKYFSKSMDNINAVKLNKLFQLLKYSILPDSLFSLFQNFPLFLVSLFP